MTAGSRADNTSSDVILAHAPGHERSATGLVEHFKQNQTHNKRTIDDNLQIPTTFDVSPSKKGVFQLPNVQESSARLLNDLLKNNQNQHHVYFSETGGFHNHHAHHLLCAYALGATTEQLQFANDNSESWQRPRFPVDNDIVTRMKDTEFFQSMLGDDRHYHNYLAYFAQKIDKEGWKKVTTDYLFSGTEIAEDLFVRLFAGIWHNLIILGYGIEFGQPGLVAEALAGACVHSDVFGHYLLQCEELAKKSQKPCKPLVTLLQEIRHNPVLCSKTHWLGGTSFAYDDNVTSNAPPGMAELASEWRITDPKDLPYRTVEMINVNAFMAGAAQRPDKMVKIDFVFVHHINAAMFFSAFLREDWIRDATKIRLLEWYTRLTLLTFAAGLAPELHAKEVIEYKPKDHNSSWSSVIHRSLTFNDDGHVAKLIRALAHGEQVSRPWEERDSAAEQPLLPVKGDMWLQMANMAIDSTEEETNLVNRFIRGAGADEAWAVFPDRCT